MDEQEIKKETETETETEIKTEESKLSEKVYVTIDDFQKIEIRVGTVLTASILEGADKLYILSVDLGEDKPRQILSGIREYLTIEELVGKQFPFVTNLQPRMIRGLESEGMILAGSDDEGLALFNPTRSLRNGTRLR